MAEDDQLPQVVEELHDVHASPGSPIAKMQLKVKGMFVNYRTRLCTIPKQAVIVTCLPSSRVPKTKSLLVQRRPSSAGLKADSVTSAARRTWLGDPGGDEGGHGGILRLHQ